VCRPTCHLGFADCDGDAANGCETGVNGIMNCGACGRTCPAPVNGTATCFRESCGGACAIGLWLCGQAVGNRGRCVNLQSDAADCGTCGRACPSGQTCVMGACRM
jgi:hypothetical protein